MMMQNKQLVIGLRRVTNKLYTALNEIEELKSEIEEMDSDESLELDQELSDKHMEIENLINDLEEKFLGHEEV